MATKAKSIPEGFHTVTPDLVVSDAARAIEFYKRAFGAEEVLRFTHPSGKIGHAEIKIGDSIIMITDEWPGACCRSPKTLGGTAVNISLYMEDVDKVFDQAVAAGAEVKMPVQDMFWGDRFGQVTDPFGHCWSLMTHIEDVPFEEIQRRAQTAMAGHTPSA